MMKISSNEYFDLANSLSRLNACAIVGAMHTSEPVEKTIKKINEDFNKILNFLLRSCEESE